MRHLLYLAFLFNLCFGKVYKKCDFAAELKYKYKIKADDIKKWVCIADYESKFNTSAINKSNWDGSKDFGIFQINNRYWCGSDHGSNVCNIPCKALLNNNLKDDLSCAYRIKKDTEKWMKTNDGLVAWVAYTRYCKHKDLDAYMAECSAELSAPPSTEPTTEDTSEKPTEEAVDASTNPPRASGLETPIKPPTIVAEEESAGSEIIPTRVSSTDSEQSNKTDIPTSSVPPETTSTTQEMLTAKPPPRATGLGIVIRPTDETKKDTENIMKVSNEISLENIPLKFSEQEENVKVSEAPPVTEAPDSDKNENISHIISEQVENVIVNEEPSLIEASDSDKNETISLKISEQEENVKMNEELPVKVVLESDKNENIPLIISEQEGNVKVNEAPTLTGSTNSDKIESVPLEISVEEIIVKENKVSPQVKASNLDKDEEYDTDDEHNNNLKQILENIKKGVNNDSLFNNLDEPQYVDGDAFPNDQYSQYFEEPHSDFDIIDRYPHDFHSYQELPIIQLLQGNNQAHIFESRLPEYNMHPFNPGYQGYQESRRPERPEALNNFQSFEGNRRVQNPFNSRHPESPQVYLQEFDPKNAFGYVFPISDAHVSRIFKPFSFFNVQKVESTHQPIKDQSSGFNFVKPILVPELDFKPIDINIKKLIKPVKIPIPYPNINIVKETANSINIKDFIKPIHKPQFNVHPVQVGFKRIVKPVIVPTIDKKLIEIPKLSLKQVGIPFYKPSFGKTDEASEKTFSDHENSFVRIEKNSQSPEKTFTDHENPFVRIEKTYITPSEKTFSHHENPFIPFDKTDQPAERTFTHLENAFLPYDSDFVPSDRNLMNFPYNF